MDKSGLRGASIEGLRELWDYRELFYFLAWRDVKVRYKQTVLGVLWAVIQPLFTVIVFTVLFGKLANIPTDGIPGPVFYMGALLPWIFFSTALSTAGMSLVSNANLLTKIYFPRIILPAAAALVSAVDFIVGSVILVGLVLFYHVPVGANLLLWPILMLPLTLLALGVGMWLAALNVKFRDVKYAIPFGIQLWMYVTPVIYPSSMIPKDYRWLLALNPLSGLIEGFRFALAPTRLIDWTMVWVSLATTLLVFLAGVAYFKRAERAFADLI